VLARALFMRVFLFLADTCEPDGAAEDHQRAERGRAADGGVPPADGRRGDHERRDRQRDRDADRRSVVVSLTEQGRALYPEIRPLIIDVLNHLLRGFSQTEVKQLENLLLRVLHNA
jgi:hypothetical protein